MEATDPSEEIKKILLKSKVMLLKSKLALVNKFNACFDLFDLYGVVQLAFTKERLPGESRQYYTQAYLLERHVHNLTNKIYE
ncbi:hypothetical protein RIR_jg14303.t1 [Rhizophagus irregularis DAOM 181602=DAOM 197198]|nr:hypothetical protein RIR_jg14303.t1 [Rhizophagus irregularis DAOM 181602=DAOM 197198]